MAISGISNPYEIQNIFYEQTVNQQKAAIPTIAQATDTVTFSEEAVEMYKASLASKEMTQTTTETSDEDLSLDSNQDEAPSHAVGETKKGGGGGKSGGGSSDDEGDEDDDEWYEEWLDMTYGTEDGEEGTSIAEFLEDLK